MEDSAGSSRSPNNIQQPSRTTSSADLAIGSVRSKPQPRSKDSRKQSSVRRNKKEEQRGAQRYSDEELASGTATSAERMAEQAARNAGWQIPWPRIRMMSQSPDLGDHADSPQSSNTRQRPCHEGSRGAMMKKNTSSPWLQFRKLLSEVSEVFGSSGSSNSFDINAASSGDVATVGPPGSEGSSSLDDSADAFILDEEFDESHYGNPNVNSFVAQRLAGSKGKLSFIGNGLAANSNRNRSTENTSLDNPNSSSDADSITRNSSKSPCNTCNIGDNDDEDDGGSYTMSVEGNVRGWFMSVVHNHPLLVLLIGCLLMMTIDWVVTSSVIPGLLMSVTRKPWAPFSESLIKRTIPFPDLIDEESNGILMALRQCIIGGELWVDDIIWKVQVLSAAILTLLARPYTVQWLALTLVSFGVFRKSSSYRTAGVYFLVLASSDVFLWKLLGPASTDIGSYERFRDDDCGYQHCGDPTTIAAHSLLSYTGRIPPPTPPPLPISLLHPSNKSPQSIATKFINMHVASSETFLAESIDALLLSGQDIQNSVTTTLYFEYKVNEYGDSDAQSFLRSSDVYSPFADAAEESLQRQKDVIRRQDERMCRLRGWRAWINNSTTTNSIDSSGGRVDMSGDSKQGDGKGNVYTLQNKNRSYAIPFLATLSVYLYAGWCVRGSGVSAIELCLLLFVLDIYFRRGYYAIGDLKNSQYTKMINSASEVLGSSLDDLWSLFVATGSAAHNKVMLVESMREALIGLFNYSWALVRTLMHLLLCVSFGCNSKASGNLSNPISIPSCTGYECLLPVHTLSVMCVFMLQEAAYFIHNTRVWYSTVIRERRKGPSLMASNTNALNGIHTDGKDNENHDTLSPPSQMKQIRAASADDSTSAYSKRICFLCLSGYCERCLLSMEIWPTKHTIDNQKGMRRIFRDGSGGVYSANGNMAGSRSHNSHHQSLHHRRSISSESSSNAEFTAAATAVSSATRTGRRRQRGKNNSKPLLQPLTIVTDMLSADTDNGLPSLRDSLLNTGLLNPSQPNSSSNSNSSNSSSTMTTQSSSSTGRSRSKMIDAWIVSSTANCPCRSVHGVGPSAFVPRTAAQYQPPTVPPIGTLIPISQYVRELKTLGLVRPVDPASVVFSDDDPAASVLPLIFGRFTVPEHPKAVAAANALLASSATSYAQLTQGHTPSDMPFIGNGQMKPSRILTKATPLSNVRAQGAGTFRLSLEEIAKGTVKIRIAMTPVLAHLLLTHPRTAHTASVCVSGALAHRTKGASLVPMQKAPDGDAWADYTRVQVVRSDVVVRVDGVRWHDVEFSGALLINEAIYVRDLAVGQAHEITVSVCGMRSQHLRVFIPVQRKQEAAAYYQKKLEEMERARAATQARLRKVKREVPRQVNQALGEMKAAKRAIEKLAAAEERLRKKEEQLAESIGAVSSEVKRLQEELEGIEGEKQTPDDSGDEGAEQGTPNRNRQNLEAAQNRLRDTERRMKNEQDRHEERLQNLKEERTSWLADLAKANSNVPAISKSLGTLERELRDVNRKITATKDRFERLKRQIDGPPIRGPERAVDKEMVEGEMRNRNVLAKRLERIRQEFKREEEALEEVREALL